MKIKRLFASFVLAVFFITSCRSYDYVTYEYFYDFDKPILETTYDKLPKNAITFLSECYSKDSIHTINYAQLYSYKIYAYYISLTDNSVIMFDKTGNLLEIGNYKNGIPECLLAKVPHIDTMRKAISDDRILDNNNHWQNKTWKIKNIEIHSDGYLVKIGIGLTILNYYFDTNGNLKSTAIEL